MLKNYNLIFAYKFGVSAILTNGIEDKDEDKKPSFDGFGKDFSYRVNLDPNEDYYEFTPDKQIGEIKIKANLKFGLIKAESKSAEKVVGYNDGKVEIFGNNGDYMIGLTNSERQPDFLWPSIKVTNRSNAKSGELIMKDDGMIFSSDNMTNVEVIGDELISIDGTGIATATFSTDYPSVKFMAVDEDTLGVYVDTDSDGTYETMIADSDSKTGQYAPQTSPAAETVQTSGEPAANADFGFMPWIGGALLAAVIAAGVVVFVRKRRSGIK